jgi:HlyD family secretion protein
MKSKLKGAVAVLVLSGSAALWAYQGSRAPALLQAAGTIEARDAQVGSLVGGRVRAVHVETDLIDAQVREQEGQVREARARLELVRQGPRDEERTRARVEWENAESERRRVEPLLAEGVVSQLQYDEAATRAASLREVLREREAGSRPAELSEAMAAVEREEGRLAYLLRQRDEAVVRAMSDGVVQSIDLRPGDLLAANQPVATLLEPDQLWVRVYVPEPKLGFVRVGQRALVYVDSHPDRGFPGEVVEISPRAEYTPRNLQTLDQRNDQVFGVKVAIRQAPELKPGMAALATLDADAS